MFRVTASEAIVRLWFTVIAEKKVPCFGIRVGLVALRDGLVRAAAKTNVRRRKCFGVDDLIESQQNLIEGLSRWAAKRGAQRMGRRTRNGNGNASVRQRPDRRCGVDDASGNCFA